MTSISKKQYTPLRYERLRRGWTLEQVADKLYRLCGSGARGDINASMLSRWENGKHPPSLFYQSKLCLLYEKSYEELGFTESQAAEQHIPDATPDIISPHSQNILQRSHHILTHYLKQQQDHILNSLAPGSTNLWVRDIVGDDGLFISPLWEMTQSTTTCTNLVEYLIDALMSGQRILLLGDAGQGKTTILKRVFTLMSNQFMSKANNTTPLPLFIPLREFPMFAGNAIELLWATLGDEFPLPYEDFIVLVRNNQIVFLFDGFDEIKGELTQRSLNERAASKIFNRPSILSCRKGFFDFYLSMSALKEYYAHQIELLPLALTQSVTHYIAAFCQQKQGTTLQKSITTSDTIIQFLHDNHELLDLAQRPLLLVMMLDIFTDPKEMSDKNWNVTKLYRKYTEKWLKNEASKADSVLKWHEKDILVQEIAWNTYSMRLSSTSPYRSHQNEAFTYNDFSEAVLPLAHRYHPITTAQLLDDVCFRTLLAVSEGESYYFLHKSFHEYYVAKYIYNRFRSKGPDTNVVTTIGAVLQEVLPFEVVLFLKEMLDSQEISSSEKTVIVENLIRVYQSNKEDDLQSVTIRQQASHYLARLGTGQAVQFLEHNYEQEPNKWVQRGMMVGLALYCDKMHVLEQYIAMVQKDPEAASINVGYHLVYYGDQAQEDGYYDQGGERCEGTVQSLFRRLRNERYKNGWPLDLLTLSTLLEQRGPSILASHQQQLSFLKELLERDDQEQDSILQQEKTRLWNILRGANIWT